MVLQNGVSGFETPDQPTDAAVNGTGNLASEPEVATDLAVVPPSLSDEQPPITVDTLQTRIADLEAHAQKRENDYKALEGRLRNARTEPSGLNDLSDKVDTLVDTLGALIRHQGTQDQEAYMEDLQKVEANAHNRRETNSFSRATVQMIAEITGTVDDSGLDLASAPELASFRELWGPAFEQKDLGGIYRAHAEFNRAIAQYEKDRRIGREGELQKQADERVKRELEAAGINSLESDSAPMPSSMNANSLLERMGNSDVSVSTDEIKQAHELLKQQGIRI